MTIPRFNELFTDVLLVLADGTPKRRKVVLEEAVARKNLTQSELSERLTSGYSRAEDRAHWASAYLYYSGAIKKPSKGFMQITDLGLKLLAENPGGVTLDALMQTEGLIAWSLRTRDKQSNKKKTATTQGTGATLDVANGVSPSEQLEIAVQAMRAEVESEILNRLRTEHWSFMERAVLKVLLKLGYGADEDDLDHVGGPNDEGIDGIINQDKLGLDQIFVQSKRYKEGSDISGDTINAFMGAMGRKGVTKGVFITASHFKESAKKAAEENKHQQVVLIDGEELAKIMVDYKIGVTEVQTYTIYKLDENFFED
jgi:restriction system protein